MSQENEKLIRGAFAAFGRGDIGKVIDLMADDLVTHRVEPDDAVYHGKDGFFQATAEWTEDFEDWTATPEEFIDAGEVVLVRVHQKARGVASGVPVESHFWFVFVMRGGKIASLSFHSREAAALEAAGLAE